MTAWGWERPFTSTGRYHEYNFKIRHIHDKLLPHIIKLEPESEGGFNRDWREPGSGKEKNLGYAFQWFAMASALLIIFLAVNLKKTVEDIDGS